MLVCLIMLYVTWAIQTLKFIVKVSLSENIVLVITYFITYYWIQFL